MAATTKPPLPLLVNTESVPWSMLAVIKSTLPSPLTSAAVTDATPESPTLGQEANTKPPLPLLVRIVTTLTSWQAATKSSLPSPLISTATTDSGCPATAGEEATPKLPLPLLVSTERVAEPLLAQMS